MNEIQQAFENWFDSDLIGKSIYEKTENGFYKYSIAATAFNQFRAGWEAAKHQEQSND